MSIFVCVIRKKVAASVRHNELNPTHFEALPDAKILRDRVVWEYFPKGFICLKRGLVITVCIVWATIMIVERVDDRHALQEVPLWAWFEYLVVSL